MNTIIAFILIIIGTICLIVHQNRNNVEFNIKNYLLIAITILSLIIGGSLIGR